MDNFSSTTNPPPAPPLPPQEPKNESLIALKVRTAPPGWASHGHFNKPSQDHITPPAGTYFFYGTLQDPDILSEILRLGDEPTLSPARVIGYELKLWGQYPALVDGPAGAVVKGHIFEVADEAAAARLARYETKAYRARPCVIRTEVEGKEELIEGYTFMYAGNVRDLSEGVFDLGVWLGRMGRR